MRNVSKLLAATAMTVGVMVAAAPAHAVSVAIITGPYSLPANPSGVIPAGTFGQGTFTDDFTFTTIGGTYKTLMQMQNSKVSNGNPLPLTFQLFSGTPGSGTFIAGSGGTPTAATLELNLKAGSYYLELSQVSAPKELITGGITLLSSVPEPATWAMMITGVGLIGLAGRRRRMSAALG